MSAYINSIATAVPPHDVHAAFVDWAAARLGPRERRLFARMVARAGIERRWSVLPPSAFVAEADGFYSASSLPTTATRMARYAEAAPALAVEAIAGLGEFEAVTHLVVASCTGFIAPGIDQIVAARLGLPPSVERTLIGFMGCYAAIVALRTARHIVRSEPDARVLVVAVELSTLHLQPDDSIEPLLSMLLFGDGAAAALVTADPAGLAIDLPFSATLPDSAGLITWTIGDGGFVMGLSGEVPGRIAQALERPEMRELLAGDALAVHAGGRSILDAVEHGLHLAPDALEPSRAVLRDHGNMSSATLLFVLERFLGRPVEDGVAVAFGPGVAAEGLRFRSA